MYQLKYFHKAVLPSRVLEQTHSDWMQQVVDNFQLSAQQHYLKNQFHILKGSLFPEI